MPPLRRPMRSQYNLIKRFTKMVSAIDSASDQMRQPGMKRTRVRSPDCFQITNMWGDGEPRLGPNFQANEPGRGQS